MNEVIIQDINNLVESLYYTYNSKFELNDLLKRYIPNISIEKKSEKIKNKKKIKCKKKKKKIIFHIYQIDALLVVGVVKVLYYTIQ